MAQRAWSAAHGAWYREQGAESMGDDAKYNLVWDSAGKKEGKKMRRWEGRRCSARGVNWIG